jgi:hypothetical protein
MYLVVNPSKRKSKCNALHIVIFGSVSVSETAFQELIIPHIQGTFREHSGNIQGTGRSALGFIFDTSELSHAAHV